jgi:predicted deacylase
MDMSRQATAGLPRALLDGVDGIAQAVRLDSGAPGPDAVVVALLHGNETCGLAALRAVLAARHSLIGGRVTLVAANVDGFALRTAANPQAGRFVEEDMNRLWSEARLAGLGADTVEMRRARELAPLCREADLLIDLHSMATQGPRLLMFHDTPAARRLLPGLPRDHHRIRFARPLHEGRLLIEQPGLLGNPRRAGFVVECGPHRSRASAAYARRFVLAALGAAGILPPAPLPATRGDFLDVLAVEMLHARTDMFRFIRPPEALQLFAQGETIAEDGDRTIVAPFAQTVLLLPRARPRRGQEAGLLGRPVTD